VNFRASPSGVIAVQSHTPTATLAAVRAPVRITARIAARVKSSAVIEFHPPEICSIITPVPETAAAAAIGTFVEGCRG
jgi:hypothetical protein